MFYKQVDNYYSQSLRFIDYMKTITIASTKIPQVSLSVNIQFRLRPENNPTLTVNPISPWIVMRF